MISSQLSSIWIADLPSGGILALRPNLTSLRAFGLALARMSGNAKRPNVNPVGGARSQPTTVNKKPAAAAPAKSAPRQPKPQPNHSKTAPPHAAVSTSSTLDPLHFVFTTMIGQRVSVLLRDGSKWEGLFHNAGPLGDSDAGQLNVELSMAVQVSSAAQSTIDTLQIIPKSSLSFSDADLVSVTAKGISADPTGPRGVVGFQTDSEISSSVHGKERTLQSWADISEADIARVGGLGDDSSIAGWDQFEVNKREYGVQTTYNEELYTTSLDRGSEFYKQKEAEAARLAAEIEREVTSNPHLAEERGQKAEDDGLDEEDKYSSVIRSQDSNAARVAPHQGRNFASVAAGKPPVQGPLHSGSKYVVPARRGDAPGPQASKSEPVEDGSSSPVAPSSPTLSGRRGSRGAKDPSIVLARQQEITSTSPASSPKLKPQSPTLPTKLASLQLDSSSPRIHERHVEELAQLAAPPATQRREHDIASLKKFSAAIDTKIDSKKKESDDDASGKMNPNAMEFKPGMGLMSILKGGSKKASSSTGPQIVSGPAPSALSVNYPPAPFMGGSMGAVGAPPSYTASNLVAAPLNSFFDRPVYADSTPIAASYASAVRTRLKGPRTPSSTRIPALVGAETWADPGAPPSRRSSYRDASPAISTPESAPAQSVAIPPSYYPGGYEYAYVPQVYSGNFVAPGYGYQYSGQYVASPQTYPASPPQARPHSAGSPVTHTSPSAYSTTTPPHNGKRAYFNPNSPGFVPQSPTAMYSQVYQANMPYYNVGPQPK
eukprot:TRINITY_DN4188_c0_g1_i1.p1 TRINITY_DN4188_c0_g1~~TRINITY_DN4188_c0_g1_i1.p1  ORF type:complete len:773 (+),score=118.78 TRINITY_DN4188_c0_g1_i1:23-2341(+)